MSGKERVALSRRPFHHGFHPGGQRLG
jgi:hypothetical protein